MLGLSLTRSLGLLKKRNDELAGRNAGLEKALALDGSLSRKEDHLKAMDGALSRKEDHLKAKGRVLGILEGHFEDVEQARCLAKDARRESKKEEDHLDSVRRDLAEEAKQLRGLREAIESLENQLSGLKLARAAYDKTKEQYEKLSSEQEAASVALKDIVQSTASEQEAETEALQKLQASRAAYDQQWKDTERIMGTMQDVRALHEREMSLTKEIADATEALNSLRQKIKDTKRKRAAESALAILETDLGSGFVSEWAPDLVKSLMRHDETRTKKWLLEYLVRKPEGHSVSLEVDANSLIVDGDPIELLFATYWRENSGQAVEMDALVSCWERLAESGGA